MPPTPDPDSVSTALGLLGGLVVSVAAVVVAWGRLVAWAQSVAWGLVRDQVLKAAADAAGQGDASHVQTCDSTHTVTGRRLDALEESSAATRRAIYGDPPHAAGLLDRLGAVEVEQRAEAARAVTRHGEVISRLDQALGRS